MCMPFRKPKNQGRCDHRTFLVKLIQRVDAHEKMITPYIIEKPQGKLLPGVRFDRSR